MRRRILIGFVSLTVLVLLVLEVPLGLSYASRQRDQLRTAVERDTFFLAAAAHEYLEVGDTAGLRRIARQYARDTGGRVVVVDPEGQALVDTDPPSAGSRTFSTRPEVADALDGRVATRVRRSETLGGGEYVYVAVPVTGATGITGVVRVSYPTSEADEAARRYWFTLAAVAAVSLAVATAVGVVIARSVSRPLLVVEQAATKLGDGDLAVRAPEGAGPVEVQRLGRAFNDMATRLAALIGAQEAFVADASHQLRTPLTALRLRLEILDDDVQGEARDDLAGAQAEVLRLSRLVDGLLALARVDRTAPGAVDPIDVDEQLSVRAAAWQALAAERGVDLLLHITGAGLATVTPDRLDQVLDNLLANALEVSSAGSTVTLRADRSGASVQVRVIDQGPGLPAPDRARAFDRFWRGTPSDAGSGGSGPESGGAALGGSGLGLAIVAKLVEADGGTVRLDASSAGGIEAVVTYRAYPAATTGPSDAGG